jgi:hypothetical protein
MVSCLIYYYDTLKVYVTCSKRHVTLKGLYDVSQKTEFFYTNPSSFHLLSLIIHASSIEIEYIEIVKRLFVMVYTSCSCISLGWLTRFYEPQTAM